jgi:hypothetical protein
VLDHKHATLQLGELGVLLRHSLPDVLLDVLKIRERSHLKLLLLLLRVGV